MEAFISILLVLQNTWLPVWLMGRAEWCYLCASLSNLSALWRPTLAEVLEEALSKVLPLRLKPEQCFLDFKLHGNLWGSW